MALKRPSVFLNLPSPTRAFTHCRTLHRLHAPTPRVPAPTPFAPDVPTFLTLIGRNLYQHAAKIPSWEALFSLSGRQLRDSGIEPARARRYLLWWRERYRNGLMGIGGDCKQVKDGVAELRVVEVPSTRAVDREATLTRGPGMRKVVVNVTPTVSLPPDPAKAGKEVGDGEAKPLLATAPPLALDDAKKAQQIAGVKMMQAYSIGCTGIEPVKAYQGVARLRVKEGLWEQRRGHKVDGGERRKAEVRYKRRAQERKMAR